VVEEVDKIVKSLRLLDHNEDSKSIEFKGQAATQFKEVSLDIKRSLDDLARVAKEVRELFKSYGERHKDLRLDERTYYAVAKVWYVKITEAKQIASSLERQGLKGSKEHTNALAAANPEGYHQIFWKDTNTRSGRSLVKDLAGREKWLESELVHSLRNINLGSLGDPGLLERGWDVVFDKVVEPFLDIARAFEMGDWGKLWYEIKDIVDVLSTVLSIAAFAFPVLTPFALGLAALNLAMGIALITTDTKSADGSRSMSWQEVAYDGLTLAVSGAAHLRSGQAVKGGFAVNPSIANPSNSRFVQSLAEGGVFERGVYNLAFKPIAPGSTFSRAGDFLLGNSQFKLYPFINGEKVLVLVNPSRLSTVFGLVTPEFGAWGVDHLTPSENPAWRMNEIRLVHKLA
jgi:hypothetical protein